MQPALLIPTVGTFVKKQLRQKDVLSATKTFFDMKKLHE